MNENCLAFSIRNESSCRRQVNEDLDLHSNLFQKIVNGNAHVSDTPRRIVYVSRTETFSACHRLHSNQLSEEQNKALYGKCNHPNGHGHNYKVEVILKGPVDPATGMVINLVDLKKCMEKSFMDTLDHRNIDKDVPYFKNIVSTAENIAVYIWERMKEALPDPSLLFEVKVHETEKNVAFYRGECELT